MMTYDDFKDKIKETIVSAKQPLTWTQVRTIAKLPQLFPNNQWVRRMEKDIGLVRKKDSHGNIHWSIK
jgi:hypothetical protein